MLHTDVEGRSVLVRERQAELERAARLARRPRPVAVESRRHRTWLRRMRIRLRPAGHLSWDS